MFHDLFMIWFFFSALHVHIDYFQHTFLWLFYRLFSIIFDSSCYREFTNVIATAAFENVLLTWFVKKL